MWNKDTESGCKCHGTCEACHDGAPKTKEEKIAHLEKKEEKIKKMLEQIKKMKESVKSGKKMEEEEA